MRIYRAFCVWILQANKCLRYQLHQACIDAIQFEISQDSSITINEIYWPQSDSFFLSDFDNCLYKAEKDKLTIKKKTKNNIEFLILICIFS